MSSSGRGLPWRRRIGVVLTAAVIGCAGCDAFGPAPAPGPEQRDEPVAAAPPTKLDASTPVAGGTNGGLGGCASQSAAIIDVDGVVTREVGRNGRLGGLVVSPSGDVTLAWSEEAARGWSTYAVDQPSAGRPQRLPSLPPRAIPPGATTSDYFPGEDFLRVDGAGVRTATWLQDLRMANGYDTESYDVAVADTTSTGWSTPTVLVSGASYADDLAVSTSGAAVVLWNEYRERGFVRWLSLRRGRHAPWSARVPVPPGEGVPEVEIDDAGRVSVAYNFGRRSLTIWRLGPAGAWTRHRVGGPRSQLSDWGAGAGGVTVVAFDRGPRGHHATARMSPSGEWSDPVRQPGSPTFPGPTVDVDGRGRALWAIWDRQQLVVRSSGPRGRWQRPCVLADHIRNPRYYDEVESQVLVNRRGDAIATWRTKVETPRLWASYRPAGQAWSQPVNVSTAGAQPPDVYRAAIGEGGHAAVAWVSRNSRQISVVRLVRAG